MSLSVWGVLSWSYIVFFTRKSLIFVSNYNWNTIMDEKGRKVIVCDNGTGVSSSIIHLQICVDKVSDSLIHHFPYIVVLVCKMWICWEQLPRSHISLDGRKAYHQGWKQDWRYWCQGMRKLPLFCFWNIIHHETCPIRQSLYLPTATVFKSNSKSCLQIFGQHKFYKPFLFSFK